MGKETDFASRRALADSNFELATLTSRVGNAEAALAAHRAVLLSREALTAQPDAPAAVTTDVARSLTAIAEILYWHEHKDEGLAACRRAVSLLEGLAESDPDARAALANSRTQLARLLMFEGKLEEALSVCRLARVDQEVIAAVPGASKQARSALAETVRSIGFQLWVSGKWDKAVPELRSAVELSRKLLTESPDDIQFRYDMAAAQSYLGMVLPRTGNTAEAEAEFRAALEILQNLVDDNPSVGLFRTYLGCTRWYYAELLLLTGAPSGAEAECRKALALFEKLVDDDSKAGGGWMATCYRSLGGMLLQEGKRIEAEVACRKARELSEKLAAENPSYESLRDHVSSALDVLGDVVRSSGRAAEAKAFYDRAIAMREQRTKEDPASASHVYRMIALTRHRGLARRDIGDNSGATADTRRALDLCDGLSPRWGQHLFETACCHAALADLSGRAGSGVSAAEGAAEAASAMEWLGRAVANGYRNTNQLRIESALNPLRDRADFKKLMAELENNTPPKHEKK